MHPIGVQALDPARDVLQFNCQTWGRLNGLPFNGINGIAQTRDGYLWLGTSVGLVRFDGTEFKMLDLGQLPDIQTSSMVNNLFAARDGGLWVGLENSSYGFSDGEKFSFRGRADWGKVDPAILYVHSVHETKDGAIWLGADGGVLRLNRSGEYQEVLGASPNALTKTELVNVLTSFEDSKGRMWFGTAYHGVYYWQDGKVAKLPDPTLDGKGVLAVAEDREGQIWIGAIGGLYCYGTNLARTAIPPLNTDVHTLLVDKQGSLWIGTAGEGLARYQNGAYTFIRKTNGLASDYVRSLLEDREGSLWIGTREGVSQLTDVKFNTQSAAEDPNVRDALSVSASRKGGIWVGSAAGLTYFDGKAAKTYGLEAGLTNTYVKRVFEAADGDVYLVSGIDNLVIFSAGKVVTNYHAASMVVGLAEDARGVVASVGGSLFRASRNGFAPYTFTNGTPDLQWILNLASGRDGEIWVACNAGIFQVKDGGYRRWGAAEGVPESQWVYEDNTGVVWGASLNGVLRLKDNQVRSINRKDGLLDNNIYSILPDLSGNLWVDSGRGIFKVNRKIMDDFADGKTNRIECVAYDGPESVKPSDKTTQEHVACRTADGRIWFPSANGVVTIDPTHIPSNRIAPPVHIDSVRANGVEMPRTNRLTVPPGAGELELHFSGLSFIAPHQVRYRYMLEGYDQGWVEAKDRHLVYYTNLKPGSYQFRVIAANADGFWNESGDTLEVALRPHFYQTSWFYGLCAVLGCGALSGVYFRRERGIRMKEEQSREAREFLKAEVERQTAELASSRAFFQTLVDQLPVGVFRKDREGRYVFVNEWFCRCKGLRAEHLMGKTAEEFAANYLGGDQAVAREFTLRGADHHAQIMATGKQIELEEFYPDGPDGGQYLHVVKSPVFGPEGGVVGSLGIVVDLTQRKLAEQELVKLHQQLVETSRLAGMAEIATNVLHNVGNVLNSVNVSAALVMDQVRNSNITSLSKVAALLKQHEGDLAEYISGDPKGKHLPTYLVKLAEHLLASQETGLRELESLKSNIDHINEIVAMQQSYAKISGVKETVKIDSLVEDSLRMNIGALNRHRVEVVREFGKVPPLEVEKHKILQILVNLVRNAKYACDESGLADKRLTVRVVSGGSSVRISVMDNGVGIAPENLTRIFNHGFTTRKNGHGFGLHSGALAAKEMGGSLTALSEGPGCGATFILELPIDDFHRDPAVN